LKNTVTNAKVVLSRIDKPAEIPNCPGTAYGYFDISTNLEAKNLNSVTLNFRVSKAWTLTNSVELIKLYRYQQNGWQELKTLKFTEDNDYIYFSAEAPALSLFAIGGEKKAVEVAPPTTPTPSVRPPTPVPITIPPVAPAPRISLFVILLAIVAVVTVAVAYVVLRRRRT